jgi:hypothetical protein
MKKRVTINDVIRRALPLVENERTWTRGAHARSSNGASANPTGPHAVRWCAVGALEKAAAELSHNQKTVRRLELAAGSRLEKFAGMNLYSLNDDIDREAVVAVFKKALAA